MDRVAALAALDRRMLEAFSGRTVRRLRAMLPLRIALPHLEPFLTLNVEKEIRKDALVIRRAAQALATGALPGPETAREVLEATKQVDAEFLRQAGRFPVRIEIPYGRIAPLRLKRIACGLDLAHGILSAWRQGRKLRDAFDRDAYRARLVEILRLYAAETQALSHAVRLPSLIRPLRDLLARRLAEVMDEAAGSLVRELVGALHRRRAAQDKVRQR